jgi:hypothetical protein
LTFVYSGASISTMGDRSLASITILVGVLGAFVSGCTQVVVSDGAQVHHYWLPGLAIVKIEPDAQLGAVTSIEGAGVVVSDASLTLGWHREQIVSLPTPGSCQVIFIIESPDALAQATETLERSGLDALNSCAFSVASTR